MAEQIRGDTVTQSQSWLIAPLVAAIIAAVGYVAKLAVETAINWSRARREQRARLVALQSLLLSSNAVFGIQNKLVRRLCAEITSAHPEIGGSYDQILATAYPILNDRQKLEHGVIRHYTSNCLLPLNSQMSAWLSNDTYFKGGGKARSSKSLSNILQQLEIHLFLWRAKYDLWIPSRPEHALVYLADEAEHGLGFPSGIEALVADETGSTINLTKLLQWSNSSSR